MIRVFISHSSNDSKLAETLIHLIREALNLPSNDIRCTSVDGYRLPGGADTDEQLRLEVSESEIFIGLLSEASLSSSYVIFELGARWGSKKHLFPLLAPDLAPTKLSGPLASLNALSCTSSAQMHQLVSEISEQLKLSLNPPASYQKWIEKICAIKSTLPEERSISSQKKALMNLTTKSSTKLQDVSDQKVIKQIRANAEKEYPNDFSTQKYVVDEQIKAWRQLQTFSDDSVPIKILQSILNEAKSDYPDDYSTQLYVAKEQLKDWKALNQT